MRGPRVAGRIAGAGRARGRTGANAGRAGTAARDLRGALRVTLLAPGALPRQVALNLAITGANLAAFAFCAAATGTTYDCD